MRDIKFRAWDGIDMFSPQDLTQNGEYWTWLGKQDVVLMQYTGLKDKNVWESDIVLMKNGSKNIIDFRQDRAYEPYRFMLRAMDNSGWSFDFYNIDKVIGNIWENKQ